MPRRLALIGRLWVWSLAGASFFSCNGGKELSVGVVENKQRFDQSSEKTSASRDDDEHELADEPAQVSGAFLACGFMDDETTVANMATSPSFASVEVGCGLYHVRTGKRVDSLDLTYTWKVYTSKQESLLVPPASLRRMEAGDDFYAAQAVPLKHMMATLVLEVKNRQGQSAVRLRSIPTIRQFDMRHKRFDALAEIALLGLGQTSSADAAASVSSKTTSGIDFWDIFRPIVEAIKQRFAPEYAMEATESRGNESFKPIAQADTGEIVYVPKKASEPSHVPPGVTPPADPSKGDSSSTSLPPAVHEPEVAPPKENANDSSTSTATSTATSMP